MGVGAMHTVMYIDQIVKEVGGWGPVDRRSQLYGHVYYIVHLHMGMYFTHSIVIFMDVCSEAPCM